MASGAPLDRGATLEAKIRLVAPVLEEAAARLWTHPRAAALYPHYLVALHGAVRASVPLMEEALGVSRAIATTDGVAAGMLGWLERHLEEERGHDDWLLEDLEVLGVRPEDVWARPPADSTARAVGAQYYWIRHDHPVALLGYVAVLEGAPPSVSFLDDAIRTMDLPPAAFRTLYRHAESDVGHGRDIRALLDELPLLPRHEALLARSAFNTVAELSETLLAIVR